MQEPDLDADAAIVAVRTLPSRKPNLTRHRHAHGQLMGTASGLLSIETGVGRWVVPAIHAAWIPPHTYHQLLSHGPFEGWSVYVSESDCANLPRHSKIIKVSGLLREAAARAMTWENRTLDLAQERIAAVILDEIGNAAEERLSLPMPTDPRLVRVANALIEHPEDTRLMNEWARWAAIAPRTLSRKFSKETGFNFMEWRQHARLLRALEMLAERIPVTTITFDLGYGNVSAFIALFRRTFGMTPGRYF